MKSPHLSLMLLIVALCGLTLPAFASPLASPGSRYSVYIEGSASGAPTTAVGIFDDLPTSFDRSTLALTLTENETNLGGSRSRITIDVSANGDIFPITEESGIISLGLDGNGLDFVVPVWLEQAIVRLYIGTDLLFESENLLQSPPVQAWDGIFPGAGNALFVDGLGGLGVSRFELVFDVAGPTEQQVPEPNGLLLCSIALIGLACARRRRRVSGQRPSQLHR